MPRNLVWFLLQHFALYFSNSFAVIMLIVFCAFASSCKERPQRSEVFPVRGRLTIGAKPAEKATVYFHPRTPIDGSNLRPMAIVLADGSFRPTTYQANDGLPAGEYAVTVSWPMEIVISPEEIVSGDDRLGGRYSQLDRPAARVTIFASDNELKPIELK